MVSSARNLSTIANDASQPVGILFFVFTGYGNDDPIGHNMVTPGDRKPSQRNVSVW